MNLFPIKFTVLFMFISTVLLYLSIYQFHSFQETVILVKLEEMKRTYTFLLTLVKKVHIFVDTTVQ